MANNNLATIRSSDYPLVNTVVTHVTSAPTKPCNKQLTSEVDPCRNTTRLNSVATTEPMQAMTINARGVARNFGW